ncbi:MAG: hypothetical protein RL662_151 [Bacteroidota bacterium]|jgi:hypothetical protein
MKKFPKGPRLYPKLKEFVNGSYPYNPIITPATLDTWWQSIADCTARIGNVLGDLGATCVLGALIKIRARSSRLMLEDRKRYIRFRG